jgi:hypothetical protein
MLGDCSLGRRVTVRQLIAVFTGWNIYDKPALTAEFARDRVLEAIRPR